MPETISTIHTERLDLRLMTPAFFEAAMRGGKAQAAQLLGVPIHAAWWPVSHHKQMRLEQVRENPALHPRLERGIVLRSSQTMVGSIAFHMAPEPDPVRPLGPDGVEFGYTIFESGYFHSPDLGWVDVERRGRHGCHRRCLLQN